MTEPRGSSALAIRFWAKVIAGILFVLLVMVWEHVQAQRLGRQVIPMKQEADRLTYENARLQMQINQWVSPSHLDALAKKELKMGPLDNARVIGIEIHD